MTYTKNNLPVYEEQQFLNQNQQIEQIQEILNKFLQPIPSNFIPIGAEHMCSTKPNWEGKPLSERYFFTHKEKEFQIDIPHTLIEELGLEKGEDITQPLYLDPKVLTRPETYRGITIKESEIFVEKFFTIQNLKKDIDQLFKKIEELEIEKEENQETIEDLQKRLEEAEKSKNDWKNEWLTEWRKNKSIVAERDDYQIKWHNSLEDLEQKEEIIRSYLRKIEELENRINEKEEENNQLTAEKNNIQKELEKEQKWWDRWINDNRTYPYWKMLDRFSDTFKNDVIRIESPSLGNRVDEIIYRNIVRIKIGNQGYSINDYKGGNILNIYIPDPHKEHYDTAKTVFKHMVYEYYRDK